MKILEWLNKLGILRWGGTTGVYHNAKERPLELQQDDVFNAQRDLVNPPQAEKKSTQSAPEPSANKD